MKYLGSKYDVARIKSSIDPCNFYLQEQNISQLGYRSGHWAIAGLCPFHDDRRAGSFKVNLQTGAFKCWSCGVSGGDIIFFLQQRDCIGFIEALEKLSRDWGVC